MKTWTVVVEIIDNADRTGPSAEAEMTQQEIENAACDALDHSLPQHLSWRVMETIPAPYGPQHPDGVFIVETKVKP